jgi:hypothetical protein
VNHCPRCGEAFADGQEYCVECGLRLPGPDALGLTRDVGRGWVQRSLVGLVVAVVGGVVAIAATGESGGAGKLLTATGGFATTPQSGLTTPGAVTSSKAVEWPLGQEGWTITLVSLPQTGGKKDALTRARKARKQGLPTVGVLDSSRYASLHPGYWVVFSGVYSSEAEATSDLEAARAFTRTASVRRIVP